MSVKVIKNKSKNNATDLHLQVKSYVDYEIYDWDSEKIVEALREECRLSKKDAERIAENVYHDIKKRKKNEIDISTLKNIVNYHLFDNGFNGVKLAGQVNLGMSLYDLKVLFDEKSSENSNISSNNPEALSLTVSENTFKKFALKEVFSKDVSKAHLGGLVHLHDLGQISKNYCSAHSLRAIAKFGIGKFFGFDVKSEPAKHAQTLVGHLNTFLCSTATYYAGALGVDFVNVHFAPYVEGMSEKEMKQLAQYLIFSLSQSAFSRGGQVLFTDFNVHISIPDWLKDIPAIGPSGKVLDRTLGSYEDTARKFLKAMLDVWREGDSNGTPFAFPKCDLHICHNDFEDEEATKLLKYACQIASENGSVYFVMDRDSMTLAACCRLRSKLEDESLLKEPERIRFCGFQNISINIPQCSYRAEGDFKSTLSEIRKAMDIAIKGHLQKKSFIEKIGKEPGSPMYEVVGKQYFDGEPYVNLDKATYIIGLVGVNEAVKNVCGQELHESEEAFEMGLDIVTFMYSRLGYYKEKYGLKFTLEESPAESAARRLAKVDIEKYPVAKELVNGSLENDDVYYTNSIHYRADAPVDIVTRIMKQSEFHSLIESGAIIHIFCGENLPSSKSIYNLVEKTFHQTDCSQFCISPDFTICSDCSRTVLGLKDKCDYCNNTNVKHMSRVVGYYSLIENWNVSKRREHHDRHQESYQLGE